MTISQPNYVVEGVLTQPSLVTTISPIDLSLETKLSPPTGAVRSYPANQGFWGTIKEQEPMNDTGLYKEEFLFPSERFKIVEENLLYETKVIKHNYINLAFNKI